MILAARALCYTNQQILVIRLLPDARRFRGFELRNVLAPIATLTCKIIIAAPVCGGEILISTLLDACHVRRDYVGA